MGTKYSSVSVSGYNSSPPVDDGTVSEANKIKWSTIKTKLPDPLNTAISSINSALTTHFNNGPTALTTNTTLGATHYNQIIQVSGSSVTLTLSDAATLAAGWFCWIRNTDTSNNITIGRATSGDTFNGTAANETLRPLETFFIAVNAAANGFITFGQNIPVSNGAINEYKGADIASASTTNIGAATGNFIDVTGTTTITAFDSVQAGIARTVRFTGALTLTHNATSLILPGSVNITTANGDRATFRSLGSGNWVCISYILAAGLFPAAQGCSKSLISSSTASASNYFQFDNLFSSTYDAYELIVIGARPTTDGSVLKMQVATGVGPTYDTSGNYTDTFHVSNDGVATEGGTTGRAYISLSGEIAFGNASTKPNDSTIRIYHPMSAAFHKMVKFNTTGIGTGAGFYEAMGSGKYNSATAITGIRLFYGTAGTHTIAEGSAYLYGFKKS